MGRHDFDHSWEFEVNKQSSKSECECPGCEEAKGFGCLLWFLCIFFIFWFDSIGGCAYLEDIIKEHKAKKEEQKTVQAEKE